MKKILSVCLVLLLAATTVGVEPVIGGKDNPEFLYVLSAKPGTFEGDTLTCKVRVLRVTHPNHLGWSLSLSMQPISPVVLIQLKGTSINGELSPVMFGGRDG